MRLANESGRYLFDFVSPGTYTVTIEIPGFSTFVQENVLVQTRGDYHGQRGPCRSATSPKPWSCASRPWRQHQHHGAHARHQNDQRTADRSSQPVPARHAESARDRPLHDRAEPVSPLGREPARRRGNTSTKNDILVDGVPQPVGMKGTYVPTMDTVSEVSIQQNSVDSSRTIPGGPIFQVAGESHLLEGIAAADFVQVVPGGAFSQTRSTTKRSTPVGKPTLRNP
jgi:hypothetical protein